MDRAESHDDNGRVIDIPGIISTQPSNSQYLSSIQHSTSTTAPNTSFAAKNFAYWISLKVVITLSQIIIAAIVVKFMSRHEHPSAGLFRWLIVYVSGYVATIPVLFWQFYHRNETLHKFPSLTRDDSVINLLFAMASSFTTHTNGPTSALNTRLKVLVECLANGLYSFLALWILVGGSYWLIYRKKSSDAPNLHRLCVAFYCFTIIGNLMPLIVSCCTCHISSDPAPGLREDVVVSQNRRPTINSTINLRDHLSQKRGATIELINSLATYKFKTNKGPHETSIKGGVVASGTENVRVLSGEDAVCSICLANYADNDELRGLLCSHFFHKYCVDKWLKINAFCPLCRSEVGGLL